MMTFCSRSAWKAKMLVLAERWGRLSLVDKSELTPHLQLSVKSENQGLTTSARKDISYSPNSGTTPRSVSSSLIKVPLGLGL